MTALRKILTASALLALLGLAGASQAEIVSSGFANKPGIFDSGTTWDLAAGDYKLELTAFTFGPAGPFIFGIANSEEAFQIALPSFGTDYTLFTTVGGIFEFLVGGAPGAGAIYEASITAIEPVPLPPAAVLLATAVAAMATLGRRARDTAVTR